MVELLQGIRRLQDATSRDELLGALWDLRDSAFDHPEAWGAVTAETLFQALAEVVEGTPFDGHDGLSASHLLASALEAVLVRR